MRLHLGRPRPPTPLWHPDHNHVGGGGGFGGGGRGSQAHGLSRGGEGERGGGGADRTELAEGGAHVMTKEGEEIYF